LSTALTGLLVATAVVMLADVQWRAGALVYWALLGSLTAGLALASASGRSGDVASQELVAVPALFVVITLLVVIRNDELPVVLLVPIAGVVGSLVLRVVCAGAGWRTRPGLGLEYLAAAGISASLLAACVFGLWQSEHRQDASITGGFLLTIVGAVLGGVFLPHFKADFEQLMQVEGDPTKRQPDRRPSPQQAKAAAEAWPRLVGYAASALTSMLVLTIALAFDLGWRAGHANLRWPPRELAALAGGLLLVVLVPVIPALAQARKRHPREGPRLAPSDTSVPAWCCFLAGVITCAVVAAGLLQTRGVQPLAIAQALLITVFAAQSILGNAAWLNLGRIRGPSRAAVGTVGLAVLMVAYWSLTDAVRPGGSPALPGATVLGWFMAWVLVVVLVELTAAAVYVAGDRPYRTDYPPANNVAQDLFHLGLLWFMLGWLPQFVLANIPGSASERWSAIGTILAGFLLLFGPAFLWILENNDTHVERQRRVREVPVTDALVPLVRAHSSAARIRTLPSRIAELIRSVRDPDTPSAGAAEEAQFLVRLSGHTAVQNALALTLATTSAIGVIGVSAGLTPNATGLSTLPGVDDAPLRERPLAVEQ
jgi:hypothetical protein